MLVLDDSIISIHDENRCSHWRLSGFTPDIKRDDSRDHVTSWTGSGNLPAAVRCCKWGYHNHTCKLRNKIKLLTCFNLQREFVYPVNPVVQATKPKIRTNQICGMVHTQQRNVYIQYSWMHISQLHPRDWHQYSHYCMTIIPGGKTEIIIIAFLTCITPCPPSFSQLTW